jgi:hypothetical protein
MSKTLKLLYVLLFSSILLACNKDDGSDTLDPLDGLVKLKEGYALGASAKVEIWGKQNFYVGYNNLIVVLYDSLNLTDKITDAHIHFMPLMTMGSGEMAMQHASPVENPDEEALNGVFPGAVIFVMPTSADGAWQLSLSVHNHKYDKEGEAEFDITVDNPATSVLTVFTALTADNSKLVLSLMQPADPKVGMNDIEMAIHKKVSMMDWPPDDTYTIEIAPEMPSMGHGSPNNVNPTSIGNGHYKGKVNFTMTGEWKVNVLVKKDGADVSQDLFFTIVF